VILLVALTIVAAAVVVLFLLPHDGDPVAPTPSPSATRPSASPSSVPSPTPTPSAPSATNTPTPPSPPELSAFRDEVSPRLDAMTSTLSGLRSSSDPAGTGSVQNLRDSLQRISDLGAPDQIRAEWSSQLIQLDGHLQRAQSSFGAGTDATPDVDSAIATIGQLQRLLGS
jgi:hypothetical protein